MSKASLVAAIGSAVIGGSVVLAIYVFAYLFGGLSLLDVLAHSMLLGAVPAFCVGWLLGSHAEMCAHQESRPPSTPLWGIISGATVGLVAAGPFGLATGALFEFGVFIFVVAFISITFASVSAWQIGYWFAIIAGPPSSPAN